MKTSFYASGAVLVLMVALGANGGVWASVGADGENGEVGGTGSAALGNLASSATNTDTPSTNMADIGDKKSEDLAPDAAEKAEAAAKKKELCESVCYDKKEGCTEKGYHSKVKDGYYSDDPSNMALRRADRTNNPGAINTAKWIQALPGYLGFQSDGRGNNTAIFDSPETGIAVYKQLMSNYASGMSSFTIRNIILKYAQTNPDLGSYMAFVSRRSGIGIDTLLDINDTDTMVPIAQAMFRYESGQESKLSDLQFRTGWNLNLKNQDVDKYAVCNDLPAGTKTTAGRTASGNTGSTGGSGGTGSSSGSVGTSGVDTSSMMALVNLLNQVMTQSSLGGTGTTYTEPNTKTADVSENSGTSKTIKVTLANGKTSTFVLSSGYQLWACGTQYEVVPATQEGSMTNRSCDMLAGN